MNAITKPSLNASVQSQPFTKLIENWEDRNQNCSALKVPMKDIDELHILSNKNHCDRIIVNNSPRGGFAYCFAEKNASFCQTPIPIRGKSMVAGLDEEGCVHVYAIRDKKVYTSHESSPHEGPYTNEAELNLNYPIDFGNIERLEVQPIEGGHALFTICSGKNSNLSYISCRICHETHDYLLPVAFSKGAFAFSGTTREELTIHLIAQKYAEYNIKNRMITTKPVIFPKENIIVQQIVYQEKLFCLYAHQSVHPSKQAFVCVVDTSGDSAVAEKALAAMPCRSMVIQNDKDECHYAFLSDHLLYAFSKNDSTWTTPHPIDSKVSTAAFSKRANKIALYYFQAEKRLLVRFDCTAAILP